VIEKFNFSSDILMMDLFQTCLTYQQYTSTQQHQINQSPLAHHANSCGGDTELPKFEVGGVRNCTKTTTTILVM